MLTIINIIKVLLILGLFVYVLYRKDKDYLLKAAFLFTFASDVLLAIATADPGSASGQPTILGNEEVFLPLGTMVFCFAQLAYFCRHCSNKNVTKIYLIFCVIAVILIFVLSNFFTVTRGGCPKDAVCVIGPHEEALIPPSVAVVFYALIYALTEVLNFIFTLKQDRRTAIGFAFFITCDLIIALGYIEIVPEAITSWLCWIFYLPAQILLAISPKPVLK